MDNKEIFDKIKEYIAKGHTEKALEALVNYTKEKNESLHDEAILLSGQFSQWKRENMLGVQQSTSELRRIEMSVMDLLQEPQPKPKAAPAKSISSVSGSDTSGKSNMMPIIGGIVGFMVIALGFWYFIGKGGGEGATTLTNEPETTSVTTPAKGGNDLSSSNIGSSVSAIAPGTIFVTEEKYYSDDGRFFIRFQDDGNLCVLKAADESFIWGSYQAGAPLTGKSAILQQDGNLVIYDETGQYVWGTQSTVPMSFISITENGVLQIVAPDNTIVWEGML